MTRPLASVAVLALMAGCAARATISAPPPAPPLEPSPELRVVLVWDAPVDLDLYVTDPSSETIHFAHDANATGARLEHDEQCGVAPPGGKVELVRIPEPRPGRYRIGVDFVDACGTDVERVGYRLIVVRDSARQEATGTAELARFLPVALEVDLVSQ